MFTVFKKILTKNAEITDEDIGKISDFVFCRWLSGNPNTLQLAQFFNLYYDIPLAVKVKMAQKVLGGKIRFIQYPKSIKDTSSDDVKAVSEFYNISLAKANLYMEFISDDELRFIRQNINSKKQ